MNGARYIAETLQGYGVTHVFYMDAILRKALVEMEALGIGRIIAHSEKAAAYMADGYARVSHRPGVCMAQSVGAANLAAGLQDAYLGRSPVVALTGKKPPPSLHRNAYQEIVHHPLFEPVTKYNVDVTVPEQLPHYLRQAFRAATSGSPGPVHLDLLSHNARALETAEGFPEPLVDAAYRSCPPHRPAPDDESVRAAAQAIQSAERPVIVAGGGVRLSGAGPELVALAEKGGIPVATSVNGKGIITGNHPLNVGPVGSYSVRCANQVVSRADLVIYVGSNTGDQVTLGWKVPAPGTRIVQIDIEPAEIGRSYPNTLGVAGDAKAALNKLKTELKEGFVRDAWLEEVNRLIADYRSDIEPLRTSSEIPIRPERLCKELGEWLPADAVLVADTGYSAIWTATMLSLDHPGQDYLRAAGSLGWAFPASLGVKCAVPDRPVVCFTGDGGFWYHLSELETAARFGINTITVVNNNSGLAQGIRDVHALYGDRPGDPGEMYRFGKVSFARIAQEMGCAGMRVEQPDEIRPALENAAGLGKPVVVEVITGLEYQAESPWSP